MKKAAIIFAVLLVAAVIGGWVYNNSVEPRRAVEGYYEALINENYEQAYSYLLIFDEHYDTGTDLSESKAKANYLMKIDYLKRKNYKVVDFDIQRVRSDDGGAPRVYSQVTIQVGSETKQVRELIQYHEGNGIFIDLSEDEYAKFRGGVMDVAYD